MGKCNFKSSWLAEKDHGGGTISQWCKKHSNKEAFCKLCNCIINISNKGLHAILQHSVTAKHNKLHKEVLGKQMTLCSSQQNPEHNENNIQTPSLCLFNPRDQATVAELIWVLKYVCCGYSANSCTNDKETLEAMFPGAVPKDFSISPKKMHYLITDALGVYFRKKMLDDIHSTPYSLSFDETTNIENKKELQLTVRYWSDAVNRIVTRHLETFFLGKADAQTLYSHIISALDNAHLPLSNILMLGSDGPNVNKKVHTLLNEELLTVRSKGLIDIGTCPIHKVHNAFLKALESFGDDVPELVRNVHDYFDGWPSRWEEYEDIQKKLGLPAHRFIKHVSSRWLTLSDACKRLIEQWPAVSQYFLKFMPMRKTSKVLQATSYKNIVSLLKKSGIVAEIHFVVSSSDLFQTFTKKFQTEKPLVQSIYSELLFIVRKLASRVCDVSALKNLYSYDWESEDLFTANNLLSLNSITVPHDVKKELCLLDEKTNSSFMRCVQSHYITGAKYLIEKAVLPSLNLKKALACLGQTERKTARSCHSILKVARSMPFKLPEDLLLDEWKSLQMEKEPEKVHEIDEYWAYFFSLKNSDGSLKYPSVGAIVKAALSLSHGNADIERRFSVSKFILSDSPQMALRTLNGLLMIKDAMKHYNKPFRVPITKELILLGQSAHKRYQTYLEEQKELAQKKKKLQQETKKQQEVEEEKIRRAEINKAKIKEMEFELHKKKKNLSSTRDSEIALFNEARSRLQKAVDQGDLSKIKVAKSMFDGLCSLKESEQREFEQVEHLQAAVEKRKSSLIANVTTKKLKQ